MKWNRNENQNKIVFFILVINFIFTSFHDNNANCFSLLHLDKWKKSVDEKTLK